jgi:hypothetical protein
MNISYALLADGSSDRALIPILNWIFNQYGIFALNPEWIDLSLLPQKPASLEERIISSLKFYRCNLLFIHRDAETQSRSDRQQEIIQAFAKIAEQVETRPPMICVIPVRMMEAWLLSDERAIRQAVGNPNGRSKLELPTTRSLEAIADPKQKLHELLRIASGLSGRRLRQLNTHTSVHLVAEYTQNFGALRQLSAFQALENDIQKLIEEQGTSHDNA